MHNLYNLTIDLIKEFNIINIQPNWDIEGYRHNDLE